ncbi:H-NS histone family protein [Variovorax ureilyticus]|uniref:H-NS histone family protein n=1 Tax=Variovorax ureilyticus TaxID=1836198 RepID=A0ABU8VNI7_9BURK
MAKSYAQLQEAIAKLEQQAAALRATETTKVVSQIREAIATYGLTVEQLFGRAAKAVKALVSAKAARKGAGIAKYRDPKTGKTWTGFGKPPAWLATVRNRDKFLIDQSGVVAEPPVATDVAPAAVAAKKTVRKARTVAAPAKKSVRAKKVAAAPVAAPEVNAEVPAVKKSPAKKAAAKKSAPSKKAAPAKKAVAAPKATKAASKAPKKVSTKTAKPKAPAKSRRSRTTAKAAAPSVAGTAPGTPESATSAA